jgi:hypothetical protein
MHGNMRKQQVVRKQTQERINHSATAFIGVSARRYMLSSSY